MSGSRDPAEVAEVPVTVQSVDRAVTVLELLAARGEAGVTELAAELGVHKSTVSRLLGALLARDLVEQPDDRGRYRLGPGILRLAAATGARRDLARDARPVCAELAAALGETVNVAVADGGAAVNVDQVMGGSAVTTWNWVGRRTPLHATSSGKVLLAAMSAQDVARHLPERLQRFTTATVVRRRDLLRELRTVAEQGWACAREEYEVGLTAVAAPVRDHQGCVVAALSAAGPSYRLPPSRLPEVVRQVGAAAAEVSRRLGHAPPVSPAPPAR